MTNLIAKTSAILLLATLAPSAASAAAGNVSGSAALAPYSTAMRRSKRA
jgi:hypothetical protein